MLDVFDDSPRGAGPLSLAVDFETTGIGIYRADEVGATDPPATFCGRGVGR